MVSSGVKYRHRGADSWREFLVGIDDCTNDILQGSVVSGGGDSSCHDSFHAKENDESIDLSIVSKVLGKSLKAYQKLLINAEFPFEENYKDVALDNQLRVVKSDISRLENAVDQVGLNDRRVKKSIRILGSVFEILKENISYEIEGSIDYQRKIEIISRLHLTVRSLTSLVTDYYSYIGNKKVFKGSGFDKDAASNLKDLICLAVDRIVGSLFSPGGDIVDSINVERIDELVQDISARLTISLGILSSVKRYNEIPKGLRKHEHVQKFRVQLIEYADSVRDDFNIFDNIIPEGAQHSELQNILDSYTNAVESLWNDMFSEEVGGQKLTLLINEDVLKVISHPVFDIDITALNQILSSALKKEVAVDLDLLVGNLDILSKGAIRAAVQIVEFCDAPGFKRINTVEDPLQKTLVLLSMLEKFYDEEARIKDVKKYPDVLLQYMLMKAGYKKSVVLKFNDLESYDLLAEFDRLGRSVRAGNGGSVREELGLIAHKLAENESLRISKYINSVAEMDFKTYRRVRIKQREIDLMVDAEYAFDAQGLRTRFEGEYRDKYVNIDPLLTRSLSFANQKNSPEDVERYVRIQLHKHFVENFDNSNLVSRGNAVGREAYSKYSNDYAINDYNRYLKSSDVKDAKKNLWKVAESISPGLRSDLRLLAAQGYESTITRYLELSHKLKRHLNPKINLGVRVSAFLGYMKVSKEAKKYLSKDQYQFLPNIIASSSLAEIEEAYGVLSRYMATQVEIAEIKDVYSNIATFSMMVVTLLASAGVSSTALTLSALKGKAAFFYHSTLFSLTAQALTIPMDNFRLPKPTDVLFGIAEDYLILGALKCVKVIRGAGKILSLTEQFGPIAEYFGTAKTIREGALSYASDLLWAEAVLKSIHAPISLSKGEDVDLVDVRSLMTLMIIEGVGRFHDYRYVDELNRGRKGYISEVESRGELFKGNVKNVRYINSSSDNLPMLYGHDRPIDSMYPPAAEILNGPIAKSLIAQSERVKTEGFTPVVACDIDGTISDSQKRVVRIGQKFFKKYLERNGKAPKEFYNNDKKEWEFPITKGYWNITDFLQRHIGNDVDAKYSHFFKAAEKYFSEHFFNLENWERGERIRSTMVLLRAAKRRGIPVVFTSLRGISDDVRPDGGSYTQAMLEAYGVWGDNCELAFKNGRSQVINANDLRKGIIREPSKADQFYNFIKNGSKLDKPKLVAIFDNDKKVLNQFTSDKRTPSDVLFVLVEGDLPPGSPPAINPNIKRLPPVLTKPDMIQWYRSLSDGAKKIYDLYGYKETTIGERDKVQINGEFSPKGIADLWEKGERGEAAAEVRDIIGNSFFVFSYVVDMKKMGQNVRKSFVEFFCEERASTKLKEKYRLAKNYVSGIENHPELFKALTEKHVEFKDNFNVLKEGVSLYEETFMSKSSFSDKSGKDIKYLHAGFNPIPGIKQGALLIKGALFGNRASNGKETSAKNGNAEIPIWGSDTDAFKIAKKARRYFYKIYEYDLKFRDLENAPDADLKMLNREINEIKSEGREKLSPDSISLLNKYIPPMYLLNEDGALIYSPIRSYLLPYRYYPSNQYVKLLYDMKKVLGDDLAKDVEAKCHKLIVLGLRREHGIRETDRIDINVILLEVNSKIKSKGYALVEVAGGRFKFYSLEALRGEPFDIESF